MGIDLPKDIIKSIYQCSYINDEFNFQLYNEKLKEYINQHAKTVDIVCINTNGTPNRLRKRLLKVLKNEGIKR